MISTSWNCARNLRQPGTGRSARNSFGPYWARRWRASSVVMPRSGSLPSSAITWSTGCRYAVVRSMLTLWSVTASSRDFATVGLRNCASQDDSQAPRPAQPEPARRRVMRRPIPGSLLTRFGPSPLCHISLTRVLRSGRWPSARVRPAQQKQRDARESSRPALIQSERRSALAPAPLDAAARFGPDWAFVGQATEFMPSVCAALRAGRRGRVVQSTAAARRRSRTRPTLRQVSPNSGRRVRLCARCRK